MINNEVVYQVAKENGFTCNEEELKLKYAEIEASINSNSSYKAKIQSIGVNEGYILTEIKKDLVIQKYRNNFEQNINITEEDLKKYYNQNIDKFKFEEVNPSHILISSKYEKGKLIKIAQEILYKINDGESFEKLAIKYSDDRESGKNGGNLGYLKKGDKNIEFSNIAFKLGKGEISNIIETSYGYHIIKLNDRKEYIESFEDSREDIKKFILDEKYKEHVEKLNKNADIKVK